MKTIIFLSLMQVAFFQSFAKDHDHDHDRDRNHNNYSNNRGHIDHNYNTNHNNYNRGDYHRNDVVVRHDAPYRDYDNHILYHNDYAYRNGYRPGINLGYAHPYYNYYPHPYHSAYIPLINFSFGATYPYGYAYQSDFDRILIAVNSQAYDDSRLTVAKQAIQNRSLTSNEVLSIMKCFQYDNTRLEFAEIAYDHVVDVQNFYAVNNAFAYSGSVDELNSFLESNYGTH